MIQIGQVSPVNLFRVSFLEILVPSGPHLLITTLPPNCPVPQFLLVSSI